MVSHLFLVKLALVIFLSIMSLRQNSGKPQQRRQADNEPRWSTQRTNNLPGVDQEDLTLTLPSPKEQENHKFVFPNRFHPIAGPIQARGARHHAEAEESQSRVRHNYYSPKDFGPTAIPSPSPSPVFPHYNQAPKSQPTAMASTPTSTLPTSTEGTTAIKIVPTPKLAASASNTASVTLATPSPAPGDNREIRFLIHKPGDEEIIKRALYEDSLSTHEQISFLQGPTLKLEQRQKIMLPPKRKTVVYVFIKEPEIETKVEMVESPETVQDQPQVFIFYQKSNASKGQKEHHHPVTKARMAAASINLGGIALNSNSNSNSLSIKQASLNKAPSASNQVTQVIGDPTGCLTHFSKN